MPSVRDNRLTADYSSVQQAVAASGGSLRLVQAEGSPPTRYVIEFHCKSWGIGPTGERALRAVHQVEIRLGPKYPFEQPSARMLTPVFNPHVYASQAICLGHRWNPTETLDALVLRIGALLQWDPRVIDVNSLANREAGNWLRANPNAVPLDNVSFRAPQPKPQRTRWYSR
jgi:ubiquitin-protein ligase